MSVPAPTELQIDAARTTCSAPTIRARCVCAYTRRRSDIHRYRPCCNIVRGHRDSVRHSPDTSGGTIDSLMMRVVDILPFPPWSCCSPSPANLVDRYDNHIRISSAAVRLAWMHAEADHRRGRESPASDGRASSSTHPTNGRASPRSRVRTCPRMRRHAGVRKQPMGGRPATVRCIHTYGRSFDGRSRVAGDARRIGRPSGQARRPRHRGAA